MDITQAINTAMDRLDDGEEIISGVDRRRRDRENAAHGTGIPAFHKNSLLCLSPDNTLRKVFINLVYNKWFDRLILLTIMTNCIFLAINDPLCSKLTRVQVDAGGCR